LKNIIYIICIILSGVLQAQDLHFSQYNENPSLLNPALTGASSIIRASLNYRDQWRSVTTPYKTLGASAEMRSAPRARKKAGKYGVSKSGSIGRFAGGVSVYRDRAGDGKMGITMGNLSLATFVPVGKRSTISAGLQTSLVQRRLDHAAFVFPNQFNGTGYDVSMESGESLSDVRYTHADYAAGLLWFYGQDEKTFITHREIKARLGVSAYHIMEPQKAFMERSLSMVLRKYVAHGDLLYSLGAGRTALAPSFMMQLQGNYMELTGGMMLRYYMNSDTKYTGYQKRTTLGFGGYYRNGDALILSFLMEWEEQYALGLSYDVNTSKLAAASGRRGGLELTLRYSAANSFLYQHR
jgi:type IX secretion system PorP/SprF family membrane protein